MSQNNLEKEKNSMEDNVLEPKEDNNLLSNLAENTNLQTNNNYDWKSKLKYYSKDEQAEIETLSEQINVIETDKVMEYGSNILIKSFDYCNSILKEEAGTTADQLVMKDVKQLIEKANKSYDDFNLQLREPNFLEKVIFKIYAAGKSEHTKKIQKSALSNFAILIELKASCDKWKKELEDAIGTISNKYIADLEDGDLLEKYLVAGAMAQDRIEMQLATMKQKYEETGSLVDEQEYNKLKDGSELFAIRLENLKRSYFMYRLSVGQLRLILRSNRNVQMSIKTQTDCCMNLIAGQLTNAVLNAKNREVIDGQQALIKFDNDLVQKVSQTIGETSEEAERLLYRSIIDVDAARNAITTVINSLQAIDKITQEELPKMRAGSQELEELRKELEPYINKIKQREALSFEKNIPKLKGNSNPSSSSNLKW